MKHCTVLIVLAIASTGFCADPKAPKADTMNGRWTPETAVMAGEAFPEEMRKSIHLTLSDGKYTVNIGDQVDEGTYKVDESKTPKTITIVGKKGPNEGKTILGIYELDKGTLKVCYDMSGKAFPAKFESKADSQLFLASYTRQKMKKKGFRAKTSAGGELK
ncbi:MAG TPA: TIGR03067 domain-containing protein [Planctomycetaceae bacterium]|nr:TIGR03067 domain-containing protein [Planctomycetaceae bacterium]